MVTLTEFAAGKTVAELDAAGNKLEAMADMKAAAAKAAAAKGGAIKGGTVTAVKAGTANVGGTGAVAAKAVATSAKVSAGTIWTGKGLSLGLGLGLGAWGPALLLAGGAAAGWLAYKHYFQKAASPDEAVIAEEVPLAEEATA